MNAPDSFLPVNNQSLPDVRALATPRAAVSGLRCPVRIRTADGAIQPTAATLQ